MIAAVVFGLFIVLILLAVPIAVALSAVALGAISIFDLGTAMISRNFEANIAKFPLIAIPFFILVGYLMEKAKIAEQIAKLATIIVGRATGGLALASIASVMLWGAISGSGPATAAAMGVIFIPFMIKQGYSKYYAASVVAAAAGLDIIIPPSIAFIVYGNVTGVSVGALFLGGFLPGFIMAGFLMIGAWIVARRHAYRGVQERGSLKEILAALRESIWALIAPIAVLGSIYAGIATPTEAAVIGIFYAIAVGVLVYRTIDLKVLMQTLADTVLSSAVVMFVVAMAGLFSWAASTIGVVTAAADAIASVARSPMVFVFLANVVVLIAGMFLDAISINYVLIPVLLPVMIALKVDLLYFGIIFTTALAVGQITPPVAVNLYVTANLIKSDINTEMVRNVLPMVLWAAIGLFFLSLFPQISTWLPAALKLYTP
jgi:C4-dicarboxylate transporter DctM subunit